MNRIYRRIWNAIRQCWMVASELATGRGKPSGVRRAVLAVPVTLFNAAFGASASPALLCEAHDEVCEQQNAAQRKIESERLFAAPAPTHYAGIMAIHDTVYGDSASFSGDYNSLFGRITSAKGYGTAVGYAASAANSATVVGASAIARSLGSIAIGRSAATYGETSEGLVAIGHNASVTGDGMAGGIALGTRARAYTDSTALGYKANANGGWSVALGADSVTSDYGVVSVGNSTSQRRIVNVREGRVENGSTDAITGGQLYKVQGNISNIESIATSARNTANAANITANTALTQANTVGGLIKQSGAGGDVRIGGSNSGAVLDVRNSGNSTRRVTGVAGGAVNSTSTDAVNGGQLYATDRLALRGDATATAAMRKADALAGLLSETATDGNVRIGAQNAGSVLDMRNQSNAGRRITGVLDGALSATSDDAVTGKQLFATDTTAKNASSYATSAYSKATALEGLIRQEAVGGNVRLGAENTGTVLDVRNKANANRKITGLAAGAVGSTSTEAVTGAQLYSTDQTARSADTSAKAAVVSASSALGKVTTLEGLVMQVSPTDAVRLGAENNGATLDVQNKSGGKRTIAGVADGAVTSGSSEAITGNQLNRTNGLITNAQRDIADAVGRLTGIEQATRHIAVGLALDDEKAKAGRLGIALGDSAVAAPLKDGAVALGSYSRALGENSVALGRASWVHDSADGGFALGVQSVVEEQFGLALGAASAVRKGARNGVAIGDGSIAVESQTASFGNGALQRRLTNLARGTADHNATTVGQLTDTLATLGGGARLDASGNVISPNYIVQNTSQRTVQGALKMLDDAVVKSSSRVDGMEGQLRSLFQDTATARADGFTQLTLAGAQGMVISNVANGLIAAGSREAVNGGQLHAVQQQLNGRIDGLEHRVDGNGPAPQSRAMALATTEQEAAAPTPPATKDDKLVADTGNAPKSSPTPQPKADAPESPKPQVDTAELEKMLARANDYSDGIAREVDARLNKMDKRFNRMAAMSSAQTAMAMNTAGLATYNRLGAGVGYAEGESAMAVGYQRVLNEKGSATFSLNGAFTNSGERSMGVGVGIGW